MQILLRNNFSSRCLQATFFQDPDSPKIFFLYLPYKEKVEHINHFFVLSNTSKHSVINFKFYSEWTGRQESVTDCQVCDEVYEIYGIRTLDNLVICQFIQRFDESSCKNWCDRSFRNFSASVNIGLKNRPGIVHIFVGLGYGKPHSKYFMINFFVIQSLGT